MNAAGRQEFKATLHLEEHGHITLEAGPRVPIAGGPPIDFGGTTIRWSPEHLVVGAAGLCFLSTLEWQAGGRGIELMDVRCTARGTIEMTSRGLAFNAIDLDLVATAAPGQANALRDAIARAQARCLVSASLTCPVRVRAEVTEGHVG